MFHARLLILFNNQCPQLTVKRDSEVHGEIDWENVWELFLRFQPGVAKQVWELSRATFSGDSNSLAGEDDGAQIVHDVCAIVMRR
jgi:hypothetical protein